MRVIAVIVASSMRWSNGTASDVPNGSLENCLASAGPAGWAAAPAAGHPVIAGFPAREDRTARRMAGGREGAGVSRLLQSSPSARAV
jgi:hypothetical protein